MTFLGLIAAHKREAIAGSIVGLLGGSLMWAAPAIFQGVFK